MSVFLALLSAAASPVGRFLIFLAFAALLVFCLSWVWNQVINTAVERGRAERDVYWHSQIAAANAKAAAEQMAADARAKAASQSAETAITQLQLEATHADTQDATLPDVEHCGLDAGRVRSLN